MWGKFIYEKDKQVFMAAFVSVATYLYSHLFTNGRLPKPEPVITISTGGSLRGVYETSRNGLTFASFYGIPFAKPPVNQLRFEPPLPPDPWKGTRDARAHVPECIQVEAMVTGRIQGQEDCLYLNIFVPEPTSKAGGGKDLLPIMVFFHGGLFISGGAKMYGPKYFMDEQVILVVPQYRLGSLGFLSTGDKTIPGNMGLKDQNLALKWIQQNARFFRGDPSKVTLFGNSAGGSSVHFHMLSPYSKGLFHRSISESGTAIKIWTLSKQPKEQSRRFAEQLKCPTHATDKMIECLKNLPAASIVKLHLATMSPIRQNTDLFVPTVDGDFIPDNPLALLSNGSFHRVPWLTGVNAGEGLLNTGRILANDFIYKNLQKNWNDWIPLMLDYDKNRVDVSQRIKDYYFGKFKGRYFPEDVKNMTDLYSHRVYFHATEKAVRMHSQYAPAYLYYYTYPGEFSFFSLFKAVMPSHEDFIPPEIRIAMDIAKDLFKKYVLKHTNQANGLGPCHADELPLLFNMHRMVEVTARSKDYFMSKSLVKAWADFAKTEKLSAFTYQRTSWPNATVPKYMVLNLQAKINMRPFAEIVDFWNSLDLY